MTTDLCMFHAEAVALAEAIRQAPYRDKGLFLDAIMGLLVRLTAPAALAPAPTAPVKAGALPSPCPASSAAGSLHVRLASQVAVMRQQGLSIARIARELGTSTRTIGRALEGDGDDSQATHQ
jgi:hypothetical protein